MSVVVCPVCRQSLQRTARIWRCAQGHSFDVAREGYVNLLLAHQKNSPEPGDSAEMIQARRAFLAAAHYQPLRDCVIELLQPLHAQQLLDIGCGEGYYTAALAQIAQDVIGLDISKPAIQLAARAHRELTWLVASGADLPLADQSVDLLTCLFTQLHVREMQRVLQDAAHVLVVTPGPDHLWALRAGLFEQVIAHEPDKFLAEFERGFECVQRRELRFDLEVSNAALRQLLCMTPYVWKAAPERRAQVEQRTGLRTQAAFSLMLFRKRSADRVQG